MAGLPDRFVAHEGCRPAGAIPGARYVEVGETSHGLPITHAALTNALLAEHFDRANPELLTLHS